MQNYSASNNAKALLKAGASAGSTTFILEDGKGALFPSTYPFKVVVEKFDTNGAVIKREIADITNKSVDTLTASRASEPCPIGDASSTQVQVAYTFDAGDQISLAFTAAHLDALQAGIGEKLNIADYQNGTKVWATTSTGTDSYAITLSPAPAAYLTGMCFRFQADVANTGVATLNVNALGAKTIKKQHDRDLESGDIEAGQIVTVSYDGTNFQMDSQVATIAALKIHEETDIGGEIDLDNDEIILYDASVGANRKAAAGRLKASAAEAKTGTIDNKFITPKEAKDNYGMNIIAGSTVTAASATASKQTAYASATPQKLKEMTIGADGTYSITWMQLGGSSMNGRIYKNDSAVGSLHAGDGTFTENITFAAGDKCQLYGWHTTSYGSVQDMYLRYSIELVKAIATVNLN